MARRSESFDRVIQLLAQRVEAELRVHRASGEQIRNIHAHVANGMTSADCKKHSDDIFEQLNRSMQQADDRRVLTTVGDEAFKSGDDDELLETLTACWLGLYFLGFPYHPAWEAVLYFSEKNGFPRGAPLCKAAGDVYRAARLHHEEQRQPWSDASLKTVYTLEHNPFSFLTDEDQEGEPKGESDPKTDPVTKLGICYEYLQFRVYVESSYGLELCIPETSLRARLKREDCTPEKVWALMSDSFGEVDSSLQRVVVVNDQRDLHTLPSCVLWGNEGVYRTRKQDDDQREGARKRAGDGTETFGRPGNYLATRLVRNYRDKLKFAIPEGYSVKAIGKQEFINYCRRLI